MVGIQDTGGVTMVSANSASGRRRPRAGRMLNSFKALYETLHRGVAKKYSP
jgi:hypothetical protein